MSSLAAETSRAMPAVILASAVPRPATPTRAVVRPDPRWVVGLIPKGLADADNHNTWPYGARRGFTEDGDRQSEAVAARLELGSGGDV